MRGAGLVNHTPFKPHLKYDFNHLKVMLGYILLYSTIILIAFEQEA